MDPKKSFTLIARLAWRNVWKNKRRTIITMITVMVGCAMIIFFRAFQKGGYEKMIEDAIAPTTGHVQIHEKGWWENQSIDYSFKADQRLIDALKTHKGITGYSRRIHAAGMLSFKSNTFGALIQAVEPDDEKRVTSLHTRVLPGGRYLTRDDYGKIVIGTTLAKNLEAGVGDTINMISQGFDGSIAAEKLEIVGIFKTNNIENDQLLLIMTIAQARETFTMGEYLSSIAIKLKDTSDTEAVRDELRRSFGSSYEIMGWDELLADIMQHIVMDRISAWFFYIILVVIVSFGVMNNVQMSVFERTRELGVMMAIGTRPGQIIAMVMSESVYVSLFGALLGIVAGSIISYYFTVFPMDYSDYQQEMAAFNISTTQFPTRLTLDNLLSTSLVIFIVGVLFSFTPARRASKLKPLDAIRQL